MTPWSILFLGWAVMAVVMVVLWLVQRRTRDAGIVDVGWALGLGLFAVLFAVLGGGDPTRRLVLGVLGGVWSLRLAVHLLADRILGKPEDGRYRSLREKWGARADRNLFLFFQVQGLLDAAFALAFLAASFNPRPFGGVRDVVAIAVWAIAVAGESLADRQLARFRANPDNRGKTCREGLWRSSRHPNYFFEWLHWWSYVLLAAGSGVGLLSLVTPALLLYLLLRVTGIPATEQQALRSRGEDYRGYQRSTSAFFPWFPRPEKDTP